MTAQLAHALSQNGGERAREPTWSVPAARWLVFLLGVFVFLLAWKARQLDSPPYNEYVEAIWTEAVFLAETDFDYQRLFFEESQIEAGGVRSYSVCIMPSLMAVLIRSFSPRVSILLYHLFVLACASLVITWTYFRLRRHVPPVWALGATAGTFTIPLFNTQLEMLGLELPVTVGVLLAASFIDARRWVPAALASGICFFLKPSAAPIIPATCAYMVLVLAVRRRPFRTAERSLYAGLVTSLLVAFGVAQAIRFGTRGAHIVASEWWTAPLVSVFFWFLMSPYFFILMPILAVRAAAIYFPKTRLRRGLLMTPIRWLRRAWSVLRVGIARRPDLVFAWIFTASLLGASLLFLFTARYLVAALPMTAVILADAIVPRRGRATFGVVILAILLVHNVTGAGGAWLLPLFPHDVRTWSFPERSLEYRSDHASTIAAARYLEAANTGEPLLVGKLFTHILSSPAFGFVAQPPAGYTVMDHYSLGRFRNVLYLLEDRPPSILIVSATTGEYQFPEPGPADEVLYRDNLSPPLVIYRKRFPPENPGAHETFVRELLSRNVNPFLSCSVVASTGNAELGEEELARRIARAAISQDLRRWLATAFTQIGDPRAARATERAIETVEQSANSGQEETPASPPAR